MIEYLLRGIVRSFNGRDVLQKVNLKLEPGLTFVLGPSGSGKSTLLNLLGLLDEPDQGEMIYCDTKINGMTEKQQDRFRAVNIGFVFQDDNLLTDLTVNQNLDLAAEISRQSTGERQAVLERLGIADLRDRYVNTLSGGERQRVTVARALLKGSAVVLADEPTGNLDEANGVQVIEALRDCADHAGRIVVVVTHDFRLAERYADRIITLSDGLIQADHRIRNLKEDPRSPDQTPCVVGVDRGRIKLHRQMLLSFKNIRRKRAAALVLALFIGLSMAVTGFIGNLKSRSVLMLDRLDTHYLETDFIEIHSPIVKPYGLAGTLGTPFRPSQIEQIENSGLFKNIVTFYGVSLGVAHQGQGVAIDDLRFINLDQFFSERVMANDVSGHFPEHDGQVILGSDLAEALFASGDPLGQKIDLYAGHYQNDGLKLEVEVTGVNRTRNPAGSTITYVSQALSMAIAESQAFPCVELHFAEEMMNSISVYTGGYSGSITAVKPERLLWGRSADGLAEIAVDVSLVNHLYQSQYGSDPGISPENPLDMDRDQQLTSLLTMEFFLIKESVSPVRIVGVYDSNQKVMFSVSNELMQLMTTPLPTVLNGYARDMNVIQNFQQTDIANEFICFLRYNHLRLGISQPLSRFTLVLSIVAVVMLLITAFMIISFVKLSISERIYEIGLLRALGGSRRDVVNVFRTEQVMIGLAGGIYSLLIHLLLEIAVKKIAPDLAGATSLSLLILLFVILGSLLLPLVASLLPLRRVYQLSPIDCIRRR